MKSSPKSRNAKSKVIETAREVLRTEAAAISRLATRLDRTFELAVDLITATKGRVIITGIGKSGLVAQKIAATLSSTGTPSFFLHPAEAIHGDLGMLVAGDTVIALSYSGETDEILRLLDRIKRLGIPLISMTGNPKSTLAQSSDVVLNVSIEKEACKLNLAPTASTTASLALGDAIAVVLQHRKGFQEDDFAELHPGGEMGRRLRRVEHLMHTGESVPTVRPEATMIQVTEEMSRKRFGMTAVVDKSKKLVGIITDGDLRRILQANAGGKRYTDLSELTAGECMTRSPLTIGRRDLATKGLNVMENRKITSLLVVDAKGRLEGLLHLHDLWSTEMF
jgi:arabinose-5-phosphate isomerase